MPVIVASGTTNTVVVDDRRSVAAVSGKASTVQVPSNSPLAAAVADRLRLVNVSSPGAQGAPGNAADTVTRIAGVALGGHRVVRSTSATTVGYASADNPLHGDDTLGLTTGAALLGAGVVVQTRGPIVFNGWTWTPGEPVFLGLNGLPTQTAPSSGCVQVIGHAEAADTIYIDVQPPIYYD